MSTTLMDPTSELMPEHREPLPKPDSLDGLTVGLLDISKARGDIFIDRIEDLLVQRGIKTRRYKKPTFTRVAPTELTQQIATECDVVVESLAD
ncbi:MAG: hypothetical protein IIB71_13495 [Proteobacteria bacterium]|nr:hypothetical protein [Pseudomonadota bacterium]